MVIFLNFGKLFAFNKVNGIGKVHKGLIVHGIGVKGIYAGVVTANFMKGFNFAAAEANAGNLAGVDIKIAADVVLDAKAPADFGKHYFRAGRDDDVFITLYSGIEGLYFLLVFIPKFNNIIFNVVKFHAVFNQKVAVFIYNGILRNFAAFVAKIAFKEFGHGFNNHSGVFAKVEKENIKAAFAVIDSIIKIKNSHLGIASCKMPKGLRLFAGAGISGLSGCAAGRCGIFVVNLH